MINRIAGTPVTMKVGVAARWLLPGWVPPGFLRRAEATDGHGSENPVVALAGQRLCEQAEKDKYIPLANALVSQVALRCTDLAQPALAVNEHGIVMASRFAGVLAARSDRHGICQTAIGIGRGFAI